MPPDDPTEEEEQELWENILTTDSETAFREFVIEQVDMRPTASVLSVGCGPGFETEALAQRITAEGHVTGIDVNDAVLAAARDRCEEFPQVSFKQGDITDLPVADASYDLAIAKQVFSEISDINSALNELYRVLKPTGRVAVTAGDRRTHVKHTPTDRMQLADEIYRSELAEQQLGTRLVGLLPEAGFNVESIVPHAKITTEITDQTERGIEVQRRILAESERFDETDLEAWERDVRELDAAGQFLSCGTAFLYIARRPE